MIDEGIAWFAERGSSPADITLQVGLSARVSLNAPVIAIIAMA